MEKRFNLKIFLILLLIFAFLFIGLYARQARADLNEIRQRGVLRHLGVPYANFVVNAEHGLSVELMRAFAASIGVEYQFVPSSWATLFADLTGKNVKVNKGQIEVISQAGIKGDLISNGLTVLDWRRQLVDYSQQATFPTQVWVLTRVDSNLRPITPSGNTETDIAQVKKLLQGKSILHKGGTCLDATLYGLNAICKECRSFPGSLNDLAPAIINGEADATLLDVPDALVALSKWPGKTKIIGPVSEQQTMGVGFVKGDSELKRAFDEFFSAFQKSGAYEKLVQKYYPSAYDFYPDFFRMTPPSVQ